jgi:hypothetical protein
VVIRGTNVSSAEKYSVTANPVETTSYESFFLEIPEKQHFSGKEFISNRAR